MRIEVVQDDAIDIQADVLALKYAQASYGLDAFVSERLLQAGHSRSEVSPAPGASVILRAVSEVRARHILLIGVEPLGDFDYREIRDFGRRVLSSLVGGSPDVQHIAVTMHGAGFGLDEVEAFESQVAGLVDGITGGDLPTGLQRITFAERNPGRAKRLRDVLQQILPGGEVGAGQAVRGRSDSSERLRAAGYSSKAKAHVFVAMPFLEDMEDVYDYGIQTAVRDAGFLCERADLATYTGDVIEWIRRRIKTASYVIADLTGANPNVYLEVGFAWASGVPTILLVQSTDALRFDVRGQRCLVYKRIKDLEKKLRGELQGLCVGSDDVAWLS